MIRSSDHHQEHLPEGKMENSIEHLNVDEVDKSLLLESILQHDPHVDVFPQDNVGHQNSFEDRTPLDRQNSIGLSSENGERDEIKYLMHSKNDHQEHLRSEERRK